MKYFTLMIAFSVFIPTTSTGENGIATTPDATAALESQNLGQTLLKDLDEKIKADQASWATQDAALQKRSESAAASGGASSVANGIVNHNDPAWDSRVGVEGRERGLDAAQNSSNAGAAVAGATGSALAAAGTGFILAGDLATGSGLLAMAGMEFAQMAASLAAGKKNQNMKEILTYNHNYPNSGQIVLDEDKPDATLPKLPEQLEAYLNKKGLDAEAFKTAFLGGQMTDQSSILEALGKDPSSLRPGELERGLAKAQGEFEKIAEEKMNALNPGGSMPSPVASAKSNALKEINPEPVDKKHSTEEKKAQRKLTTSSDAPAEMFAQQMMPSMFGLPAEAFSAQDKALLFEAFLREQGLVQTRSSMNIFQVAQSNYRSYGKARSQQGPAKSRMAKSN